MRLNGHYLWTGRSIIALCDVLSADGAIVQIRSSTGHWFSVKLNDSYAVAVLHCHCDYVCVCNRSSLTFTMNQDVVLCHCWSEDRCSVCPVFCLLKLIHPQPVPFHSSVKRYIWQHVHVALFQWKRLVTMTVKLQNPMLSQIHVKWLNVKKALSALSFCLSLLLTQIFLCCVSPVRSALIFLNSQEQPINSNLCAPLGLLAKHDCLKMFFTVCADLHHRDREAESISIPFARSYWDVNSGVRRESITSRPWQNLAISTLSLGWKSAEHCGMVSDQVKCVKMELNAIGSNYYTYS